MACKTTMPIHTVQESIDSIVSSEASILQNLSDLISDDIIYELVEDDTLTGENKIDSLLSILNKTTCKESAIASILNSSAKIVAVDNGLIGKKEDSKCN